MNKFVLCIENRDYPSSLEKWKIYPVVKEGEKEGYIRIIDESGEDYLYPVEFFVSIEIPSGAKEKLEREYIKV
jgi:hypothetical protein